VIADAGHPSEDKIETTTVTLLVFVTATIKSQPEVEAKRAERVE
jgi:hypothetical protein